VRVAAIAEQDVSRGQLEQKTSDPPAGVTAPEASGQIPHVETAPEVGTGQMAQAMDGVATPAAGLAVSGQIGQAIIIEVVAQEIGQAIVDCASGEAAQEVDAQPPSSGQAVGTDEAVALADGTAAGEPHGPPPTPMQTPPLLPPPPPVAETPPEP
jgi:hypothetical protein